MALAAFNRRPTSADLRAFGRLLVPFVAVLGGLVRFRTGSATAAGVVWAVGGAVAAVYLAVPAARRPIFLGWTGLTYPIGWVISHVVLGAVFYLVFTPVGFVVRHLSRDPLERRFEPARPSYWIERDSPPEVSRYFRQF